MQLLNYLPTAQDLLLPSLVIDKLINLLIEPFGDKETALSFWVDGHTRLLIITSTTDLQTIDSIFNTSAIQQVDDAFNNPEFIEALPEHYVLSLTIYSDEGHGLYVLRPSELAFEAN
ncbi:MAG: hypothetical protein V5789_05135 [Colwellia sp.]